MPIPMLNLKLEYEYMKEAIDSAIQKCLDHQKWILGPEVKELEEKIAKYLNVRHCIGTSSGTESLVIALRALALKLKGKEYFERKDKIITTPFTFTATGDAILRCGATPLFIDIDPKTFNLDTEQIEKYLSKDVMGILPVHLYGQACDMDKIMAIAHAHKLFVVEDVAQAFGGKWKDKKLGSIGDMGSFSFFPSKNLGGFGDAGMISTNDDTLAEFARMLTKHGGKDKNNVDYVGYNARLDTLQAAILLAKFNYIDEFNTKRRTVAEMYNKKLAGLSGLKLPSAHPDSYHVYHQYTIRVLNGKREALAKNLKDHGVATMIYYPVLLSNMNVFHNRCEIPGPLSEAQKAVNEVLSLPSEPLLTIEELSLISQSFKNL